MFYHVKLELTASARNRYNDCPEISAKDLTDKGKIINKIIEPYQNNGTINFEGYRGIKRQDIARILVYQSQIDSMTWWRRMMANNGPGSPLMLVDPNLFWGCEDTQDITDALLDAYEPSRQNIATPESE